MPRSNRAILLLAPALTAMLAGCQTVGPYFQRPDAPKGAAYGEPLPAEARLDPAAAAAGPWWLALNSPALDTTIRQALKDSPTIAEAEATLRQSQSALAQARGEAGPQASASAGVNRERANLQAFGFSSFGGVSLANPTFTLYSLGGAVSYDFDLFGGQKRRIEGAAARAEAQARRAEAAYLVLTTNVALQAVTIATLEAQIDAVQQMLADDEATVGLVRKADALGGSTATARVSAQGQLEEDAALLPPMKGQLASARHALAVLVGKAPADWTAPAFSLADLQLTSPVPVALPSEVARRRPDILAAEADLHAATADIGVATADLYPKLALTGSLTQGALSPGNLFSYDTSGWNVGAGLTAPLLNGGALRARRQAVREAALAANARYQQTVIAAFGQVADALSAIAADDELITAQRRAETNAAEQLRLARDAYRLGGGTLLEVVDAQRQAHKFQAGRVRAEGQRLADVVRLFAAVGADWRT